MRYYSDHKIASYVIALLLCGLTFAATMDTSILVRVYVSPQDTEEKAEIFYQTGPGYTASKRAPFLIRKSEKTQVYRIRLPNDPAITNLRLDVSNKPTEVVIERVRIRSNSTDISLTGSTLFLAIRPIYQVEKISVEDTKVKLVTLGHDPQVEILVPDSIHSTIGIRFIQRAAIAMTTGAFTTFLIILLASVVDRWRLLSARRLNLYIFTTLSLLALLMTSLRVHQSSVDLWNAYLPEEESTSSIIMGHSLPIRSDEWVVQTPWTLSQWSTTRPLGNSDVFPEGITNLLAVPSHNISMIGQPKFWGGLFLGAEHAFSFFWSYKVIGLLLSTYFLFFAISKSVFYSCIGAVLVFGTSSTQWWFSSSLAEILIGFSASALSALKMLEAPRIKEFAGWGIVLCISLLTIVLHPYPPFIVPLAYLGVIIVALHAHSTDNKLILANMKTKALILTACVAAFCGIAVAIFLQSQETVALAMNTVYPGRRISTGGDTSVIRLVSGFFEFWRVRDTSFPQIFGNASEASGSIPLWLIIFPLASLLNPKFRASPLALTLFTFCVFVTLYALYGIPIWLAEASAWSLVPGTRALIALTIPSVLLVIIAGVGLEAGAKKISIYTNLIICLVIVLGMIFIGYHLSERDQFYTNVRIVSSTVVISIFILGMINRSRLLVTFCTIAFVMAPLSANPVAVGLAPLLKKAVFAEANAISDADSQWLVFGNGVLSQAFMANGLSVPIGQQYVPKLEAYRLLDPKGTHQNIWNRYARVELQAADNQQAEFQLVHGDHFLINISPCSNALLELGITHIASTRQLADRQSECLVAHNETPINGLYLYQRRDEDLQ